MKYGFCAAKSGPLATPETVGRMARRGEELGYDALYAGDHIVVPGDVASPYHTRWVASFPEEFREIGWKC